jgi:Amt family ammonium transporter
MGAIVLGLVVGVVCLFFCTVVKNALGYDDSLDVFGVHCVGGIVGALGTGVFNAEALGGIGYGEMSIGGQVWTQFLAVSVTVIWCGIGSLVLYKLVDLLVGLRPTVEAERQGLDLTSHGEVAYHS